MFLCACSDSYVLCRSVLLLQEKPTKWLVRIGNVDHELRWAPNNNTFGCHCKNPDHILFGDCKMDRQGKKGPLGTMLAWLSLHDHEDVTTHKDHQSLKTSCAHLTKKLRGRWRDWAIENLTEAHNIRRASYFARTTLHLLMSRMSHMSVRPKLL